MKQPKELVVVLGEFIPHERFKAEWAVFFREGVRSAAFYLPTETVVTKPELVVPKAARTFNTRYHEYEGKFFSTDEVQRRVVATGQDYRGSAYYPEVVMVEVWEDHGDDGHSEYEHFGYRFVLAAELNKVDDWLPGLPKCMRDRYHYSSAYDLEKEHP
jgi:hypothetical protein